MDTIVETPGATEEPRQSSLERRVDLRGLPAEWIAWIGVAAVMLAIRLTGRTSWPLAPDESEIAADAWQLLQGGDVSNAADTHPLMVQLTGLMFFLFGSTDYTARVVPLLAGIGVLATLFWLRRWIGTLPAISTAIIWAISPVMVMSNLWLDGGAVVALSSLVILATVFVMGVEPGPGKSVVLGVALAVAITAHPIGWLVALFTLVPALLLIRRPGLVGNLIRLGAGFAITFLLSVTWVASQPSGIIDFPRESLSALWSDHLASLGSGWPLTVILLMTEEPLLVYLAVVGLVMAFVRPHWSTSAHPALIISCAAWAIPMLTLGVLLDGKGSALYAATLFPLVLVAGMGLSAILDGVLAARSGRGVRMLVWILVAAGLFLAVVRFADQLTTGPDGGGLGWLISAIALAILIIIPLGYAAYRLTYGLRSYLVPAVLLVLAILLAIPALRGSILLTSTASDRSDEVLLAGASTPAVDELQARIGAYSRDLTLYERDAQDPTGGHGLSIAVDEELREPFRWYFRRFPELEIVESPGELDESAQPDMVLVHESNQDEFIAALDGYGTRGYPAQFELALDGDNPTHASLLAEAIAPLASGDLVDFVMRRNGAPLLGYENLTLMIQEDHVDAFWGGLVE